MHHRGSTKDFEDTAGNALLDAINKGKGHLTKFILDAAGTDETSLVNYCDFHGKTALIRSMYIKDEKILQNTLQILLTRYADPNLQDEDGRTALSYACELLLKDAIKLLIRWNADPNIPDKKGITPLMYCAKVGNEAGISILLRSFKRLGLNVDQISNDGYTALHIAAINKNIECAAKLTIEGYASVTKGDEQYGKTAEQWARYKGCCTPEIALFSVSSQKLQIPRHAACAHYKSLYISRKSSPHSYISKSHSRDRFTIDTSTGLSNIKKSDFSKDTEKSNSNKKTKRLKEIKKSNLALNSDSEKDSDENLVEENILSKSMSNVNILQKSNEEKNNEDRQKINFKQQKRHSQHKLKLNKVF